MAANCFVRPAAIDGLTGVTAIDAITAGVTVRITPELVTLPEVVVIVVVPKASEVARPTAFIVATVVLLLVQLLPPVKLAVELSV